MLGSGFSDHATFPELPEVVFSYLVGYATPTCDMLLIVEPLKQVIANSTPVPGSVEILPITTSFIPLAEVTTNRLPG